MMCQCSRKKVQLAQDDENIKSVVSDWSNLVVDAPSAAFPVPDWITSEHVTGLSQWLRKEISIEAKLGDKLEMKLKPKSNEEVKA